MREVASDEPHGVSGWRRRAVMLATLSSLPAPLGAQVAREVQVAGVVTTASPAAVTAGPGLAWRVGLRDRLGVWGGAGVAAGEVAWRAEAAYHFLLNPQGTRPAAYAGGGIGAWYADRWSGGLIGVVGLEQAPGARRGWFVEAGFGGGVRVAAGVRWRRSR